MAQTLEPILARHPFLSGLAPQHVQLMAGCTSNVRFGAGAYLFQEGEPADRFFLIREGNVAIELAVPGRGTITLQTVGPGGVVGWSWLVPPHVWKFDGRAPNGVRALAVEGICLREKCGADHELGYQFFQRFAQVMVQRLEMTRLQLLDVYGAGA